MKPRSFFIGCLLLSLCFSQCKESTEKKILINAITVSGSVEKMLLGQELHVTATVTPDDSREAVAWRTTQEGRVTVTPKEGLNGRTAVVKATGEGTTHIYAVSASGKAKSNYIPVTVDNESNVMITSISIPDAMNPLSIGSEEEVSVISFSPDSSPETIEWRTENSSTVTVTPKEGTNGRTAVVKATGEGTTQIYAISAESSVRSNDLPVTVVGHEFLMLRPTTASGMTVTRLQNDYHYRINTTGSDPYVSTSRLIKANPADSVVLCFQYKSNTDLTDIQVYFSDPLAELRSTRSGLVPASPYAWKEWALTMKGPIAEHAWGDAGQYLRLDFGNDPGYEMELRNIHFRGMTSEERVAEEMPWGVVMNIRQDPKTQMAFSWFGYDIPPADAMRVELVQGTATSHDAFATPWKTVNATTGRISSYNMVHKALAEGLTPGTTYSYRTGYTGSWLDIGTFTTANDASEFTFLYTTDQHSNRPYESQVEVAQTAYSRFPDVKFWMDCGDMVDDGNNVWQWEQFFKARQHVFYKLPFAPTMGNHCAQLPTSFINYFNTEQVALTGNTKPGSVYSFVYGDVLFLALNSEEWSMGGYLTSLGNWMRAEVNKPEHAHVRWRIAFFHKPIYTGGTHQADSDGELFRDAMAPVFDELNIDIAFQGHDHVYEVIGPVYNKELVSGAATGVTSTAVSHPLNSNGKSGGNYHVVNGTLYFVNSASGAKRYNPNHPLLSGYGVPNYPGLFSGRLGQPGYPTYSHVNVTHDEITITTYTVQAGNSVPFDEIKVKKP